MLNFNFDSFLKAQEVYYNIALEEVKREKKQNHWIWFIFPQLKGLGKSSVADKFGIENIDHAKAYLAHPILGERLIQITDALLEINNKKAFDIFGTPDDLKLKSCMTLFFIASPKTTQFKKVIDQFYNGSFDKITKQKLNL